MTLDEKYRPGVFEDVLGQRDAINWLSRQVQRGTGQNVILSGPVGVGKTTLARIYAKALQCTSPVDSGSPCGACQACKNFANKKSTDYTELDCVNSGRFDDFHEELRPLHSPPWWARRRVLVLDEAHAATSKALDSILRVLQEPPPRATIVMATSLFERLPRSVTSRCVNLELRHVSRADSLEHLSKVCRLEGIPSDSDGLALIVEVSRLEVRQMLKNLEQTWGSSDVVTDQNVRRALKLDYANVLVSYVRAVLSRDLQFQVDVIDGWIDDAAKKAAAIKEFLVFLLTTEVLRLRRDSQLWKGIDSVDREWIVEQIRQRAAAARIPLRAFWEEMVEFWGPDRAGMTNADLIAKVIKFDTYMNIDQSGRISTETAAVS